MDVSTSSIGTGSVTSSLEKFTIIHTGTSSRKSKQKVVYDEGEEEPLVDTTAPLPLNSKKTKRLQKQLEKKKTKKSLKQQEHPSSFLDLPTELTIEILSLLKPSEVMVLYQISKSTMAFLHSNIQTISRNIISARYPILVKCFPLPYPSSSLTPADQDILLNPRRQEMLTIHKKPYQHIPPLDPEICCSCTTCVFSWNKLCLVLDYSHFQTHNLLLREPIPMIPRGTNPEWNIKLLNRHSTIVKSATEHPLTYARILETHLTSLSNALKTFINPSRLYATNTKTPKHRHNKKLLPVPVQQASASSTDLPTPPPPTSKPIPYTPTSSELTSETDALFARKGPHSYEFPFHRDNYYNLGVYMPDRKWSEAEEVWKYFDAKIQHERDLELARKWFRPASEFYAAKRGEEEMYPRPPR